MKPSLDRYRRMNRYPVNLEANWETSRFVCIDLESTGFDPGRDRIVSLAGIGVRGGEIHLWDRISEILPVAYNTASVTVHGITREESAMGLDEPAALADFLDWIADGVIVGHHIQHDITLLNTALRWHFSMELCNPALDTMESFLAVSEAGGFSSRPEPRGYSLDALCAYFDIVPHDRHTAWGDAFLAAQIQLRILKEAGKIGQWNFNDLRAWRSNEPFPFNTGNKP
ncbi:MAG TPA: 3'-5' exonuclease [Oceanipulchritudo sp.]|nr:3'-5' exonuclease [Oceanipulchritudo sp.]